MEDSYLSALFLGEALLLQLLHPGRGDRAEPHQGGEQRPQGRGEGRLQGERGATTGHFILGAFINVNYLLPASFPAYLHIP